MFIHAHPRVFFSDTICSMLLGLVTDYYLPPLIDFDTAAVTKTAGAPIVVI
jgi:hypothetical protein